MHYKDNWLGERVDCTNTTLEASSENIRGTIEAIYATRKGYVPLQDIEDDESRTYEESIMMDIFSSKFSKLYTKYLKDFNTAAELVRTSNNIQQELYPLEDPRLLAAQTYQRLALDGEEGRDFLKQFGGNQLHHQQIAKAHFYTKAREEDKPLPTNCKFYCE